MTMTDAKHTPGPWEVVPSIPEEGYNCFWLKGPNGENLADISGYQSDQTKQANAQLIARAPDLLAENEELHIRIEELENEAEVISAEFEKELWVGVRSLLYDEAGLEPTDFPVTADESYQILKDEFDDRSRTIERLNTRIAELEAAQTWRPIETAPKDGTHIILKSSGSWCAQGYWEGGVNDGFWLSCVRYEHREIEESPTHWMSLPELEKNDDQT